MSRVSWPEWWVRFSLRSGWEGRALVASRYWVKQQPTEARAWATLAHLQANQGDLASALRSQWRVVALVPRQAQAWFNLGFIQETNGDIAGSEQAFRTALDLNDRLDRAWYGLGLSLKAQGRLDEAVSALQRVLDSQPMSPLVWCQLARLHAERGAPEEAAAVVRHLRAFEPTVAARLAHELAAIRPPPPLPSLSLPGPLTPVTLR